LIVNDRNRVRWFVLYLSQDGACIDLYENHSENSLTGDLSKDTTVNPPLFSLVNTLRLSNIRISVVFDMLLGPDLLGTVLPQSRAGLTIILDCSVADPDPNPDPHVFGPPGSFYHHAKIVRKTLIPTIL
jgi:hypothetical protein